MRWFAVPVAPIGIGGGHGPVSSLPYPLAGYGLIAVTGVPEAFAADSSFAGGHFLIRTWIPAGAAITSAWTAVKTGGTYASGSPNQLALYDESGVQVALTADDATLWANSGWRGGPLVGGPLPAADEGRWAYLGMVSNGFTGTLLPYAPAGAHDAWFDSAVTPGPRRVIYNGSSGAMPTSFDPMSYGSPTSYMPLAGLS